MSMRNDLIETYFSRLINRTDSYCKQWVSGTSYGYHPVENPLIEEVIRKHIAGEITIALAAVDENHMSRWAVWDLDNENGYLEKIASILQEIGIHYFLEGRRPGRDGHLWMLMDGKLPAADLLRFEEEICKHCAVPDKAVEFFPKYPSSYSHIRAPLGIHRNQRGWIEGAPHDIEGQLEFLAQQPLNSVERIRSIVDKLRQRDRYKPQPICKRIPLGLDPEDVFAELEPVRKGAYYICECPQCGEREAYFYQNGQYLHCNRLNNCGFKIFTIDYLTQKRLGDSTVLSSGGDQ